MKASEFDEMREYMFYDLAEAIGDLKFTLKDHKFLDELYEHSPELSLAYEELVKSGIAAHEKFLATLTKVTTSSSN